VGATRGRAQHVVDDEIRPAGMSLERAVEIAVEVADRRSGTRRPPVGEREDGSRTMSARRSENARLRQLHAAGLHDRRIAEELAVPVMQVVEYRRHQRMSSNAPPLIEEGWVPLDMDYSVEHVDAEIRRLNAAMVSDPAIARLVHMGSRFLRERRQALGLPWRDGESGPKPRAA